MSESDNKAQDEVVLKVVRELFDNISILMTAIRLLDFDQRLGIAERVRDVADQIDLGVAERCTRRLVPRPRTMKAAGVADQFGRPLFRVLR